MRLIPMENTNYRLETAVPNFFLPLLDMITISSSEGHYVSALDPFIGSRKQTLVKTHHYR